MTGVSKSTYLDNLCNFLDTFSSRPLPATLYRIQHSGSRAYLDGGNLKARSNLVPENVQELCFAVAEHLKWFRSRVDSCFISVWDDPWCAHSWGEIRARQREPGGSDVVLYEIDTKFLGKGLASMVFHVDSLLTSLGLNRPTLLKGQEYLILLGVPAKAIKYSHNISEPALGAGILKQIDLEACQHRPSHDSTHRQICLTCASETALDRHLQSRRVAFMGLNGHANGQVNGPMNGHTNGIVHLDGYTNGHTNGLSNGITNGHTNGSANGQMNGNGLNGIENGHVNVNGNGQTATPSNSSSDSRGSYVPGGFLQIPHCDPENGWHPIG
ncbi:uncharacterized protein MYCFIDRAFT_203237 [Pseudocercospora fijiensis CIRAD86]|uniref:DUF7587 domain-containing protein n=1 Tax=Pseudocercospora fijiensis (strain CIRAD86) TaxID=383855 RepID=M3A1K0_PSEFD|nr:uncharacterized protein MYCFIDRAFT_203237 [Pseudocercospora fijiensis CIRAD86]EME85059.1 hypothetical protein MYCFIDRAFT_203237 [Pseudocercospora fijiensis CIRAD86]